MTFWSSQRIEDNLEALTDHPDPEMVDCNALTLRIGREVYITPGLDQNAPSTHTKRQLGPDEPITIPPGQFAFLLTEETVRLPKDVMGFISIKATYKLKGLVNVSGFHVDPGWSGPLIFTVFNAGPATIHLQRGLQVFLLWIADLDAASVKYRTKKGEVGIPPGIISNITGVVDSIYALERRVKKEVKDVGDKQDSLRTEIADIKERQSKILLYLGIASIVATAAMTLALKLAADHFFPSTPAAAVVPVVQPAGAGLPQKGQSLLPPPANVSVAASANVTG